MNPHKIANDRKKDQLIFKNFIDQADHYLKEQNMRLSDRKSLLEPAVKLLNNSMFWTYQSVGLVVYLASEWYRIYQLPIAVGESAQIEQAFNVKPLLRYFDTNSRFFLLTLDQRGCKLYEGSIDGLVEQQVDGFDEALEGKEFVVAEKQLQFHNAKVDRGNALYHGHCESEQHKTRILEYFQKIDRKLNKFLRNNQTPLILGGVDYLHAIYHEVNTYSNLCGESIIGNTNKMDNDVLHRKALSAMEPVFLAEREAAQIRYYDAQRVGRTSADIKECLQAAKDKRIDSLLICDTYNPSRYFQNTNSQIITSRSEGDMVGRIAVETLSNGGKLFFFEKELNENNELRAIFRN